MSSIADSIGSNIKTSGPNTIFVQPTRPTPFADGDLWFDTSSNEWFRYDGTTTAWIATSAQALPPKPAGTGYVVSGGPAAGAAPMWINELFSGNY